MYRRRRVTVGAALALALGVLFYLPMTLLAPLPPTSAMVAAPVEEPGAPAALSYPGYGATAVGAVDFPGLLGSSGSLDALPLASITKIVTALTVLEAHPLTVDEPGPAVAMTRVDVGYYDSYRSQNGKVVPVSAGQTYTERELLDLTLIESANNYATTLAVWAFGSQEAFAGAAQAWLAENDLSGITIVEPTGLDARNVGTAAALIELGRLALASPVVAQIVGTGSLTMHDVGLLENSNELLGTAGVTGIKTGTLDSFGANLLFSAQYPIGGSSVTVIGVVLGGTDHDSLNAAITQLLATVAAGFHELDVSDIGDSYGTYTTPWGETADAVAAEEATLLTWGDTQVTAQVAVAEVRLGETGTEVGTVVLTAGDRTVTVPLVLSADLDDPGPLWRLTHPAELF